MRVVICGGRHYRLTDADFLWLAQLKSSLPITAVISGGAQGADDGGESFARMHKLPLTRILADWNKWGNLAGPFRNAEMAEVADACIAFPGGKGTADMVTRAAEKGLRVIMRS